MITATFAVTTKTEAEGGRTMLHARNLNRARDRVFGNCDRPVARSADIFKNAAVEGADHGAELAVTKEISEVSSNRVFVRKIKNLIRKRPVNCRCRRRFVHAHKSPSRRNDRGFFNFMTSFRRSAARLLRVGRRLQCDFAQEFLADLFRIILKTAGCDDEGTVTGDDVFEEIGG